MARADAERNRERILTTAREVIAERGGEASMAEVARRAGVGMATLYRHFPSRRELLEALYVEEVDAVVAAAEDTDLEAWIARFLAFIAGKHDIAVELLAETDRVNPVFDTSRARVLAAGRPLLAAARDRGEVRADLELEQVLDLVMAVGAIRGDERYRAPILDAALAGLRA